MPGHRPALISMLVATAVTAGTVAVPLSSAADHPVVPTLTWADCGDGFECATAEVPLDHRRRRRGNIAVELVRRPAADPTNRIGTLFIGEPLGTFDLVRSMLPPPVFALLGRFDVVGYDGRGTDMDCGTDASLLAPFATPATRPGVADIDAMVAAAAEYGRRCEQAHGDLLPHLTTTAMARDLNVLRAAVGDEQLTFLGTSQGTSIGVHYASMFPGRVRAMVLDAPFDVATWRDHPLESWREQGASFARTLGRFFTGCAANQDVCGFGGDDPETALLALLATLDRDPLPAPDPADPRRVDGDEVRLAVNQAMYDPASWRPLAEALAQAAAGDGSLVRQLAGQALNNRVSPVFNLFTAINGVDQDYPDDVDVLALEAQHAVGLDRIAAAEAIHLAFLGGLWPARGRDVYDDDFHHDDHSAPIVVIGGTNDPATPYIWAERMVLDLGNARLVTYESDGHGALNDLDPCIALPAITYLEDPAVVPAEGLVCEQPTEPFGD